MEIELAKKIFSVDDYSDKSNMEEHIKKYVSNLKKLYPTAIITKEFYRGNSILVRATQINFKNTNKDNISERQEELEKEEVQIRERGINGLGENVCRKVKNGKGREVEHNRGGNGRERGG